MFLRNMGRVPTLRVESTTLMAKCVACQLDLDEHWHAELNAWTYVDKIANIFSYCVSFNDLRKIENKYFKYIESLYSQINISWFDPYFEYSIPCKSDWLSLSLSYLVRYDVTLESVKNVATMSMAPLCFLSHLGCDSCNAVLRACRYLLGFCIKSQANT